MRGVQQFREEPRVTCTFWLRKESSWSRLRVGGVSFQPYFTGPLLRRASKGKGWRTDIRRSLVHGEDERKWCF